MGKKADITKQDNGRKYSHRLCCSKVTYDLILKDCRVEILRHNPKFAELELGHDFILNWIARYYLED